MFDKQLTKVHIFLFITLVISLFDRGLAIKCRVCEAVGDDNDDCWKNPGNAPLVECQDYLTTTVAPSTGVTGGSTATSSSSENTSAGSGATAAPENTSAGSGTTAAPENTSAGSGTSAAPENTSAGSGTTAAPENTSAGAGTSAASFAKALEGGSGDLDGSAAKVSDTKASAQALYEVKQMAYSPRRRRDVTEADGSTASPAADPEWECATMTFKDNDDKSAINRGCVLKSVNFCELVKNATIFKEVSSCEVCSNDDGCNSSSTITLGLITLLLPLSIVMFLAH